MSGSNVQSGTLDQASKITFPVDLIKIMRRLADDLLLGDSNDQKGRDVLRFILSLANERNDVGKIKKGEKSVIFFRKREANDFVKVQHFDIETICTSQKGNIYNVKFYVEKNIILKN